MENNNISKKYQENMRKLQFLESENETLQRNQKRIDENNAELRRQKAKLEQKIEDLETSLAVLQGDIKEIEANYSDLKQKSYSLIDPERLVQIENKWQQKVDVVNGKLEQ